jgi:mono/diheme cytochrome c family protein
MKMISAIRIFRAGTFGSLLLVSSMVSSMTLASDGRELFEENCAACHGGDAVESERIAPPIIGVRNHYIARFPDEADFTAAITDWLKQPGKAKSQMPGAISQFGLMPELEIEPEDAQKIAKYIYSGDLEKPGWFDDHAQKQHGKQLMCKQMMGKGEMQGKGHGRVENQGKRSWWQRLWGE